MANSTEHPSNIKQAELSGEQMITAEAEKVEESASPENIVGAVNQAEAKAKSRVSQLIENVGGKLGPAAQEVLSDIKTVFAEKARQLRVEFEMRQAVRRRVKALEEFTAEESTAHLGEIFGYQDVEFSYEEATDIGKDVVQRFLVKHQHEAAEVRTGRNEYARNSRWVFYAQNPQGERFSVEFFRQGEKFNSIDIRKVVSEPGDEPKYASETLRLIVNPDGTFARASISTKEEELLIPAGEAEVLMAGYLQNLEFDAESNNLERRRLAAIEHRKQLIDFERNLREKDMLEISWEGENLTPVIKVTLEGGRIVKNWGEGMSHMALLEQLIDEDSEVAKAAGMTVTEV